MAAARNKVKYVPWSKGAEQHQTCRVTQGKALRSVRQTLGWVHVRRVHSVYYRMWERVKYSAFEDTRSSKAEDRQA